MRTSVAAQRLSHLNAPALWRGAWKRVVHAVAVAEQAVCEPAQPGVVAAHERREGVVVSSTRALEHRRLGATAS